MQKKGNDNWIIGRTINKEKRTFEIRFDFLTPGNKHLATLYPMQQMLITRPIQRPMKLGNML